MLKQTPLYSEHRSLGARLIDFGGWELPLQYGSQIDEHHRVRRDAGIFDVSHMLALDLSGRDARALLRYALANDVDRLKSAGHALYSCLLNDTGGVIDDLIAYLLAEDRYRVVVNAGTADKDLAWFESLRARRGYAAAIEPRRDLCLLAVQGPNARSRVWQALPQTRGRTEALAPFHAAFVEDPRGEIFVSRTGYTGEDGFELMFPAARAQEVWRVLLRAGVAPCGLGARDTLRLEAGMNLYGQDMDETVSPAESNLAWTIELSGAREFVGRQAIERLQPQRRLAGLVLKDRGVLRAHQRVATAHGDGQTTSGSFAPTLERSIALARVPAATAPGETVRVEVRGRLLAARVVTPPFVRNGKPLIEFIEEHP